MSDEKYRNAASRCQLLIAGKVDRLLAWIHPFRCVLCAAPATDMDLCAGCLADLPWSVRSCLKCALPLQTEGICPACRYEPPPQRQSLAAFVYEYPLDRLIAALKFGRRSCMARICGELLAMFLISRDLTAATGRPDLIAPVPLHKLRWRERGFNQAELIAITVAEKLGLICAPDLLSRYRPTAEQTSLNRRQRMRNLNGAFRVQQDVADLRIALVDDVITTGATTSACVTELYKAGAADVQVWAVARAIQGPQKYS